MGAEAGSAAQFRLGDAALVAVIGGVQRSRAPAALAADLANAGFPLSHSLLSPDFLMPQVTRIIRAFTSCLARPRRRRPTFSLSQTVRYISSVKNSARAR